MPRRSDRAAARRRAEASLQAISSAEDAAIRRGAMSDPDNPAWGAADFKAARHSTEIVPEVVAAWGRKRGRPRMPDAKRAVSLRLDPDVLSHFQATGPGWQTRINDALKRAIGSLKDRA